MQNPIWATGLRTSASWSTIGVFSKVRSGAKEDCNQSLDHDQFREAPWEKPTCRRTDVSVRIVISDGEWRLRGDIYEPSYMTPVLPHRFRLLSTPTQNVIFPDHDHPSTQIGSYSFSPLTIHRPTHSRPPDIRIVRRSSDPPICSRHPSTMVNRCSILSRFLFGPYSVTTYSASRSRSRKYSIYHPAEKWSFGPSFHSIASR